MKVFKTLLLSSLVLSAIPANAVTKIYIVASNGDRTATQTAIKNLLTPSGQPWFYQGLNGGISNTSGALSVATGSNFGVWKGYFGTEEVIIKTSYSGALAGIAAVAGGAPQKFVLSDDPVVTTTGLPNPTTGANEQASADFAFSTNFQTTSPFIGTYLGTTYATVIEETVGITPLGFYASPGFPGSPSSSDPTYKPNITTALARQLYETGSVRLAQFTGNWNDDYKKIVYAINRNTDAGQRFGALLEVGFDTSSNVSAWFPTVTGATTVNGITSGGTVTSHVPWPVAQQPGTFPVEVGSGGYSTGALVAQNLTVTLGPDAYKTKISEGNFLYPDAEAGYYVGYVTPGDANNRILGQSGDVPVANRGVALRFNGVDNTSENVKNGTYTAWLYNRILKPAGGVTNSVAATFADALRDRIRDFDAPSGGGLFDDATVKVRRSTDGGLVIPK